MTKDQWVEAALTNDAMVAELLLRMKHSPSSDSAKATIKSTQLSVALGWGNRKNRSKPTAPAATTVSNGCGKERRGSPTTHLSWSGGGGGSGSGSTSDGYDESSRPSDLSSGSRSAKANEVASTYKSQKRKSFRELKEEEHELVSMRADLNQEMEKSDDLKRKKIDFDQNLTRTVRNQSCRGVKGEETKRGFELPDLNMTPSEEDLGMMMS